MRWQAGWYRGTPIQCFVLALIERKTHVYPQDHSGAVPPSPNFPALEQGILRFWAENDTFARSVSNREGCAEWVFNDGPPFANGMPHYGHLLTGYAKDVFPRFQTMRGKQVHRRFGWDTHGLPAELEAERQLGITDKSQIEEMGIAAFNSAAKAAVLRYTAEWQEYVTRQGRWVDFDNDYKTLDPGFMESVIWAFKELYDKGLAYEGYRVLPYCWRDQTPLSNHELRMDDDVYKDVQDQSVTVTFPLCGQLAEELGLQDVRALAWTTTPWTLPSNAALAVGPEISYVVLPGADGERYLLAAELIGGYLNELGYESIAEAQAAITARFHGAELAGVEYRPVFDYYSDRASWGLERAWRILVDDYVTTTDGTGIVHQAPAYGEDDQRVCAAAGIPVILSLDDGGKFLEPVTDVVGQLWHEANRPLIRLLRERGRLFREASYVHSYPHCWRCRNPLIYRAVSSWFIKVSAIRERMIELNQEIDWVPENVKDGQFGKWLSGARDWSISRNRYFGSPIPVWKSDNPEYPRIDVYGSFAELERDFGALPRNADGEPDLHRPFVDELVRPNPDDPSGVSMMRRISDVFDVWFDSGSMPYAQAHYPFENREWFEQTQPADFIVEYIGQTRGWFYVMHVLSTALFDRIAFKRVLSHGIVLGSDGQKMSKSLRNYPDVSEVFDRDGSDAMRWFLMSSSVLRGGNLVVTEEGIREGVRQVMLPLWSTWYFFSLYANASGYEAKRSVASAQVLDRYLLAKTRELIEHVTADLDGLDSTTASQRVRDFADVLTNWYVRRSRERFWEGVGADGSNAEAFDTLYTVLETLCRVAAPLLPMTTEQIWRGLSGGESVHLADWPAASEFPSDDALVAAMDEVRAVSSSALALRKRARRRVRLPLPQLTVVTPQAEALGQFVEILRDELNVREVALVPLSDAAVAKYGVITKLTVHARVAGPRLGKAVQNAIAAAKSGDWRQDGDTVVVGGIELQAGEYELELSADGAAEGTELAVLGSGGFVLLDTNTTPELEAEGRARDLIRLIQDARRAADFDVSDRITTQLRASSELSDAIAAHEELIKAETLSVMIEVLGGEVGPDAAEIAGGGRVEITVIRA